jgi:hypothetical protein
MEERLKTGPKVDAIFHDVSNRSHEFAVMESAKLLNCHGRVTARGASDS